MSKKFREVSKFSGKKVIASVLSTLLMASAISTTVYYANNFCNGLDVMADSEQNINSLQLDLSYDIDLETSTILFTGTGDTVITEKGTVKDIDNETELSAKELVKKYEIKNLVVGNGIKAVGNSAFLKCQSLETVEVVSAPKIETCAFIACDSLNSVTMDSVIEVESWVFELCKNLQKVSAKSLQTVGEGAFSGCNSLESIDMTNVVSIGNYAFSRCYMLGSLVLPYVISVGINSFDGCYSIKLATLPQASLIDEAAFIGCSSLEKITLTGVTNLSRYVFIKCEELTDIYLGNYTDDFTVEKDLFTNCKKTGITIHVPYGDKEKYEEAFKDNTYGIELTIVEDFEV